MWNYHFRRDKVRLPPPDVDDTALALHALAGNGRTAPRNLRTFLANRDDTIYECEVKPTADDPGIAPGQSLFRADVAASGVYFDAAPDGNRFIANVSDHESAAPIYMVVNWPSEMKKK